MIPLRNNRALRLGLLFLILLGVGTHFLLIPDQAGEEKSILHSPRHLITHIQAGNYPPAFLLEEEGIIHFLGREQGHILQYIRLEDYFTPSLQEKIKFSRDITLEYVLPLGQEEGGDLLFAVVGRERWEHSIFLLSREEGEWVQKKLPLHPVQSKDVDGLLIKDEVVLVYVEREEDQYHLKMKKGNNSPISLFSSPGHIGLPRLEIDEKNRLHVMWKGTRGAVGIMQYQVFCPEEGEPQSENPRELGEASIYFGEISGQPRLFREDPGGSLMVDAGGNVFLAWTDAFWEPLLGVHRSKVHLTRLSSDGQEQGEWIFSGLENFSLAPRLLTIPEKGTALFLEDLAGNQFNLQFLELCPEVDDFISPSRFTPFYGNHRLAAVDSDEEGEKMVMWRTMDGRKDAVWARSSRQSSLPTWYDSWGLWFAREGTQDLFIEGSLLMLYSLAGGVAFLGRNALIIALIALLLYGLQTYRFLGKINFFIFSGLLLALLFFFQEFFPLFYSPPYAQPGLLLFSALITTTVMIGVARKHWFDGGEEIIYLSYTVFWIFFNSFLILLATAPATFHP